MENRITLVKIDSADDFNDISRLLFCEKVMNMNMGRVFTTDEADGYFSFILEYNRSHETTGCSKIVLLNSGEFIGIVSLTEDEEDAEVEYMLLPEYWGNGYATEAVFMVLESAKRNTNIKKVKGLTDPDNIASQKVLIKNGFEFEKTVTNEDDGLAVNVYRKIIE